MTPARIRTAITLLALVLLSSSASAAYQRLPFIIHVQSTRSDDGVMTLEQIALAARMNAIPAVIFNDHDIMRWEYGIWPLQHIAKRTIARDSVLSRGPARYLDEIALLNRKYPDLLLVPGVESAPFYYWSGSPLGKLILNGWHKHLLIAGLYRADDYRRLPIVGNERGGGTLDYRLLWPVLLILFGCYMLNKEKGVALLAALVGIVFSINNYPFRQLPYDQYHGDRGELPYQNVINYVRRSAPDTGMVFWAHPEAPNFNTAEKIGPAFVRTTSYPESLLHTDGYTGFAYFQEGDRKVGSPGGIWDRILTGYVNGKRTAPIWAVSELDFRREGFNGTYMNSFKNILLLPPDEPPGLDSLINGIKRGRFYALRKQEGSYELLLDEIALSDGTNAVTMGETLHSSRSLQIALALRSSDNTAHPVSVTVISNGVSLPAVHASVPCSLHLPLPPRSGKAYYRLEIEGGDHTKIVTNPFFAE